MGQEISVNPVLRCKFVVSSIKQSIDSSGQPSNEELEAHAVYAESGENKVWSKFTPSGNLKLYITNPEAFGRLPVGTEFFIDMTPAPKAEAVAA